MSWGESEDRGPRAEGEARARPAGCRSASLRSSQCTWSPAVARRPAPPRPSPLHDVVVGTEGVQRQGAWGGSTSSTSRASRSTLLPTSSLAAAALVAYLKRRETRHGAPSAPARPPGVAHSSNSSSHVRRCSNEGRSLTSKTRMMPWQPTTPRRAVNSGPPSCGERLGGCRRRGNMTMSGCGSVPGRRCPRWSA